MLQGLAQNPPQPPQPVAGALVQGCSHTSRSSKCRPQVCSVPAAPTASPASLVTPVTLAAVTLATMLTQVMRPHVHTSAAAATWRWMLQWR
jgi:hypothetical protein